jgi:predicted 2-oxoglutarate/Fe(II)-dependent dioxygenase YbiX
MAGGWRIPFSVGDTAPWFQSPSPVNPNFSFSTLGGRYLIFSLLGDPNQAPGSAVLGFIEQNRRLITDDCVFFAAITQPPAGAVPPEGTSPIRYFYDYERKIAKSYGAADETGNYHPFTLILDPMMRVLATLPLTDPAAHNARLAELIGKLPPLTSAGHAPVLIIPRIFEPDFCRRLIDIYQQQGGKASGYMREVEGKTVAVLNPNFKRRKDFHFDSGDEFEELRQQCSARLTRRLLPHIFRSFQFKATRIERYVVANYSSADQGFFNAHRDNTTPGTAHRRFACTINLNADEYEGGNLRFPEFGRATYRAPTGGAVVFSCSLMHEASPVTKGERYAFLPFFYNEENVAQRAEGMKTLGETPIIENP